MRPDSLPVLPYISAHTSLRHFPIPLSLSYLFRVATGARLRFRESQEDEEFVGVTDIEFEFAQPALTFYSYEAVWSGSKNVVSAFFATAVGGVIVPSGAETDQTFLGDYRSAYEQGTFSPFGVLNSADASVARFGEYKLPPRKSGLCVGYCAVALILIIPSHRQSIGINFSSAASGVDDLPSFSFLSADNLEQNDNMIVGVIHPKGYVSTVFSVVVNLLVCTNSTH